MTTTSNRKETFNDIINGNTPVLVDFFAEWCGPCKLMKPILEELHKRMGDKVRILKIDVDRTAALANTLQVQSVPTLMLFKQGRALWRKSGVVHAVELQKIIEHHSLN